MRITNNLAAMNAQRQLEVNQPSQAKATEKLSSGYKINRAGDDAAGLAISEKMRAQIRGLNRAALNTEEGINLINVADGVLSELTDMLHRIRELAVQAANDTNQESDRELIQAEINQLISEVDRTAKNAEYNTIKLFDSSEVGNILYDIEWLTPKEPAYIYADLPFDPVKIATGSNVVLTSSSSSLNVLNASAPTFPLEGLFAIQLQDPERGTVNAVIDFTKREFVVQQGTAVVRTNFPSGDFNLGDFNTFFEDAFNNPPDGKGIIANYAYNSSNGSITVTGETLGGNQARVYIGKNNFTVAELSALGLSTSASYVNASIFGYSGSDYASSNSYNVTGTRTIAPSEFPVSNTLLWSLLPDNTTFTFTVNEYTWIPPSSPGSSGYWGSPVTTRATYSVQKKDIPATTLAGANAWLAGEAAANDNFNSLSISLSHFVDREGYVRMYVSQGVSLNTAKFPPSTPAGRYYVGVTSRSTQYLYGAMTSTGINNDLPKITSSYPAKIAENSGIFKVTINGVPGVSPTPSVTIDFSSKPLPFSPSSPYDSLAALQAMADYITQELNKNVPTPWSAAPLFPATAPNPPVAVASIENGRLAITASERSFNVNITESQSDRPMFLSGYQYNYGTNWSYSITIRDDAGYPTHSPAIAIASGEYQDINDFINRNRNTFDAAGYILSNDPNNNGSILITSKASGAAVTVGNISFNVSPSNSAYGSGVFEKIGFQNPTYIDGVDLPAVPIKSPKWMELLPKGLWIHSGANSGQGLYLKLPRIDAFVLGLETGGLRESLDEGIGIEVGAGVRNNDEVSVMDHDQATAVIKVADSAINVLSTERAKLGAVSNMLEHRINSLQVSGENLTEAESRIRDTDMAELMTELTKYGIIVQAAQAMLAQANQLPQGVLQLLQ